MKSRNLIRIVRLMLLFVLTQSLVMAQPFCEGGGWYCVMNAAETTGCCSESRPDDKADQWCHPPAPVSQPESDCASCPTCNFEAQSASNPAQAAVPVSVSAENDLLSASIRLTEESHSDHATHRSEVQKAPSHAPPVLLYVMHQSFLN